MAERKLEFFLLRYVPDAVKDEFVNIGLVMMEAVEMGADSRRCALRGTGGGCGALDPNVDIGGVGGAGTGDVQQRLAMGSSGQVMHPMRIRFPTRCSFRRWRVSVRRIRTKELRALAARLVEAPVALEAEAEATSRSRGEDGLLAR